MAATFDYQQIEAHWQQRWEAAKLGVIDLDEAGADGVFYNLVEFPYPSAEGLHIGHVFKYSGVDVYGRYQRMRGRAVFQPIGFDAFGIHAENYSLRVGEHPATLIARTTDRFAAQLRRTGIAFDWSRVVDTTRPDYYRWTQWLLTRLFAAGLMYQAEAPVVWCPSCQTVLAREQTESNGTMCERCSSNVVHRVMNQWFLRMTAYADRLLDGLDALDWPEQAKRRQRHWIGRTRGVEFDVDGATVFAPDADAVAEATFVMVAAASPLAGQTHPHPISGAAMRVVAADEAVQEFGMRPVVGMPQRLESHRAIAAKHGLPGGAARSVSVSRSVERLGDLLRPAVTYRMHDWLISRQRYWGPPIPIIHCERCGPVAVPEEQLPVRLPHLADVRPTGGAASPLAAATDWVRTACPTCGGPGRRETDVSDNFVDSAWYFLRYSSTEFDDRPWSSERTERLLPVDFYAGGPEHVQRHHLYARFMTMALHDLGLVPFEEPFPKVRLGGMIVRNGAKMSKSRGNVVSPDDYMDRHGADVLRCALLFAAPWEQGGEFNDDAIAGIERFFAKAFRIVATADGEGPDPERVAGAVRAVSSAIERLAFNVAIARVMEFAPEARSPAAKRVLVRLLAPLAPHLAEELWHRLGEPFSVHEQPWPDVANASTPARRVEIPVQVDGKFRGTILVARDAPEDVVVEAARSGVATLPDRIETQRVVYVPGRVLNFVRG